MVNFLHGDLWPVVKGLMWWKPLMVKTLDVEINWVVKGLMVIGVCGERACGEASWNLSPPTHNFNFDNRFWICVNRKFWDAVGRQMLKLLEKSWRKISMSTCNLIVHCCCWRLEAEREVEEQNFTVQLCWEMWSWPIINKSSNGVKNKVSTDCLYAECW